MPRHVPAMPAAALAPERVPRAARVAQMVIAVQLAFLVGWLPSAIPPLIVHLGAAINMATNDDLLQRATTLATIAIGLLLGAGAAGIGGLRSPARGLCLVGETLILVIAGLAWAWGDSRAWPCMVLGVLAGGLLMLDHVRLAFGNASVGNLTGRRWLVYSGYAPPPIPGVDRMTHQGAPPEPRSSSRR